MRKRRFGKTWVWPAVAVSTGLLAACATGAAKLTEYVVPPGAPTARLLTRPTIGSNMTYTLVAFEDGQACQHAQHLAQIKPGHDNQSTALRAGELATLMYVGEYRKQYCSAYFSFLPKAGHKYVLASYQDTSGCAVNLLDASNGDAPSPERSYVPLTKKGNACVPTSPVANSGVTTPSGTSSQLSDFKDLLQSR
jgi:hypothetical protein